MAKSLKQQGRGFIILNVLRVMNIISLLDVVVASWIMLIMTVKTSNFFFFDGVSHFISSAIGLFLIASELSLFRTYFATYWPTLSPYNGFTFLGIAMIALGFNILGNLNKAATSVQTLGLPMWRVVISSGVLSSVMGLFNIIASYVFSEKNRTARQIRSHGAAKPTDIYEKPFRLSSQAIEESLPSYNAESTERRKPRFSLRFPIRHSQISKPFHSEPVPQARSSPIVPEIQRPESALHPANHRPYYPPSSRYSAATFPDDDEESHMRGHI
ncbi:Structure-specific endonuclease subunit slx4 protein [Rutstroemia sp. NJR-2017a BBW]|nr:Structure-specific endonuclease subunit slx4 protein [Rutstroemia sp. NJR-2017a BBW]